MKFVWAIILTLLAAPAMAEEVNLILSPGMAAADAPFYRGARVKVGNEVIPVQEADLPKGSLAEYNPDLNAIIISSDDKAPVETKALALMDVLAAFEAGAVETAAGSAK
jgi:hypothetical protein